MRIKSLKVNRKANADMNSETSNDYTVKHSGQIYGKKQNSYEQMKKRAKKLINTFSS